MTIEELNKKLKRVAAVDNNVEIFIIEKWFGVQLFSISKTDGELKFTSNSGYLLSEDLNTINNFIKNME